MEHKKVTSREYKVMLRPDRFRGDEARVLKRAGAFWEDFERILRRVDCSPKGRLAEIEDRRRISFLDTASKRLNRDDYIFRERQDLSSGQREVTLKFRHPDRHVTQDRDLRARTSNRARSKFEEDIKAPFTSLYSFSTTVLIGGNRRFESLSDVGRLFPHVLASLPGARGDERLVVVNGFNARELVIVGGKLRLRKGQQGVADCALIVWYKHGRRSDKPVAVEFSYRYGDKNEEYNGETSLRAFDVFDGLQNRLKRWVHTRSRTKTALVYG